MAAADDMVQQLTSALANMSSLVSTQSAVTQIEPFKGEANNFKKWIKSLEKFCEISEISSDSRKTLIAFQTCQGPVSDFISRFRAESPGATWEVFKKTISERFGEVYDSEKAFSALRQIRQLSDESVQIYSERLLALAKEAYMGRMTTDNMSLIEHQTTNIFIEGLRDSRVKLACLRTENNSLTDVIQKALAEQNIRVRFQIRSEQPRECHRPVREENFSLNRGGNFHSSHRTNTAQHEPMEVGMTYRASRGYRPHNYVHPRQNFDRYSQPMGFNRYNSGPRMGYRDNRDFRPINRYRHNDMPHNYRSSVANQQQDRRAPSRHPHQTPFNQRHLN